MTSRLHIDFETFSHADLKAEGVYRYAEDPSTELLVVCYTVDDGPVKVWWPVDNVPATVTAGVNAEQAVGMKAPPGLVAAMSTGWVCAHNAAFEAGIGESLSERHGLPVVPAERWICTAAKAAAAGIPRSLGEAAKALGTHPKDESGRMNMLSLCKPRTGKDKRYTMEEYPEKYQQLANYCIDDVKAERDLDDLLPDLTKEEQAVYCLDQKINRRGVHVDLAAVADIQFLVDEYKKELRARCVAMTGFAPTQTGKLADWIRANGYPALKSLDKTDVVVAVEDKECPPVVKKVLRVYSAHNMKAVSKYEAIRKAVCSDDILRGMLMYHGAGTGRWSSKIVQLQNLFRPVIKDAAEAVRLFSDRCLDSVKMLYSQDPMKVFASAVRSVLTPHPGYDFIALDYSAIEARVLAWLAGQNDVLAVFAGHGKIYEYTASRIYNVVLDAVNEAQRFVGKVAVLALGYQGGAAAFAKMAKLYGVDIDETRANRIKLDWRDANPAIVRFWYDIEDAARVAVENPGSAFAVPGKKIAFKVDGDFLKMRLPSGRMLSYFKPSLEEGVVYYHGIDTYTRRWGKVSTYGGRLTENAVQAIARDLLVAAMLRLEAAGFEIVLTVHDEVVLRVKRGERSLEEASRIMCVLPGWATGLPVKAEGWRGDRYRK